MATKKPFLAELSLSLSALQSSTLTFNVGVGEKFTFTEFVFIASGAFSVIGISDNTGFYYSNASQQNPILSTQIQAGSTANRSIREFATPLELFGNMTLRIDVIDTSNSGNTVKLLLNGFREI